MPALVDRSDAIRKITGGDGGLGELVWVCKMRYRSPGSGNEGGVLGTAIGKPYSFWEMAGDPCYGSPPGASARNPTNSTNGAIRFTNPSGGRKKYLVSAQVTAQVTGAVGYYILSDRLADYSGLSGTSASQQNTTGLAVSRFTGANAVGNQIALEIFANVGTTPRTVTIAYTNESGSSSSTTAPLGASSGTWPRSQSTFVNVSLQAGDRGVRSVESVTLSGTTGTVGDWGVVIHRPITSFCSGGVGPAGGAQELVTGLQGPPEIVANSCLFVYGWCQSTLAHSFDLGLQFVES